MHDRSTKSNEALTWAVFLTTLAFGVGALGVSKSNSAQFEVENDMLVMWGEIGSSTPKRLRAALDANPGIVGILMENVPGSNDDESNLEAALLVRERGLLTYLPSDGLIASGGTDFFLAGVQRVMEQGACIGVHSWSDDGLSAAPVDLPQDHESHGIFLDYYSRIGIEPSFYWFTLRAAPAEEMYWMSNSELSQYRVVTEIRPSEEGETISEPCEDRE